MIDFTEILTRMSALAAKLAGKPEFRWGVVTAVNPLRVRLELEADPLAGSPEVTVPSLLVGERVLVMFQNRRATVVARGGDQVRRTGRLNNVPTGALSQIGTTGIYSTTVTFVVPAVAPPGCLIDVRATWSGTGWGLFQLTSQVAGVTTTTCTARFVQPGSSTQQSLTLIWEIIPVGN